jgi:hypothetical protein
MYRSLVVFGLFLGLTSSAIVGQVAAGQNNRAQSAGTTGTSSGQTTSGAAGQTGMTSTFPGTPLGYGLVVNSGYVTTAPFAGQISAPILAPPNIALPGSGPATGAPVAIGVNDPRTGGTGSVFQPGVGQVTLGGPGAITSIATESAATGNPTSGLVLNTGLGKFIGSSSAQASGTTSQIALGDIAREYKARRANDHPREFDNVRIEALSSSTARNNANLVPQATSTEPAANANPTQTAVLDRRDLAIVEAELARSRAASANEPTAVQPPAEKENTTIAQATQPQQSQAQQGESATTPQAPLASNAQRPASAQAKAGAQKKQQLPASASNLPLIGFAGLLATGIGMAFAFRLRRI